MTATNTKVSAATQSCPQGQERLFTHLTSLGSDSQLALSQQIDDLDFTLISELAALARASKHSTDAPEIAPPKTVTLEEVRRGSDRVHDAIKRGVEELAAGRSVVTVLAKPFRPSVTESGGVGQWGFRMNNNPGARPPPPTGHVF